MNPLVTEARALCEAATFGPWKTHEKAEMSEVWDNDAWAKGFGPLALVGSQPEDAAFIARSRTLIPEMAAEIERLEGIIEGNRIPLLQYASLRKHFHALVHAVLGDDYYNMAMDTYTCDMLCCQDVAHECSKRAGKRFDKALAAMKEDEHDTDTPHP